MYHQDPKLSSLLDLVLGFLKLSSGKNNKNKKKNKQRTSEDENEILFWNKLGMSSRVIPLHHRHSDDQLLINTSSFSSCFTHSYSSLNNNNHNNNNNNNNNFINNIESAFTVLKVIETLLSNHNDNSTTQQQQLIITQRDIYYSFVELLPRRDQNVVNKAIQHICTFANCPRYQLGVYTSTKGFMAGSLVLGGGDDKENNKNKSCHHDHDHDEVIDLSRLGGCQGFPIPGEFASLPESLVDDDGGENNNNNNNKHNATIIPPLAFKSTARCILVVEKDSVFQRLVQARIWTKYPMIIITGRGFPDVATKTILARLVLWISSSSSSSSSSFYSNHHHQNKTTIPVYGLFDYNPSGVRILYNYRFGNSSMISKNNNSNNNNNNNNINSLTITCPSIRWLGARATDLKLVRASNRMVTFNSSNLMNDDDDDKKDDENSNSSSTTTSSVVNNHHFVPTTKLSERDFAVAASLKRDLLLLQKQKQKQDHGHYQRSNNKSTSSSSLDEWYQEVDKMVECGVKFDLEAIPDLCEYVVRKVVSHDAV